MNNKSIGSTIFESKKKKKEENKKIGKRIYKFFFFFSTNDTTKEEKEEEEELFRTVPIREREDSVASCVLLQMRVLRLNLIEKFSLLYW